MRKSYGDLVMKSYQLYINGKWIDGNNREYFSVENPANREILGEVTKANSLDVDLAIEAANEAFPIWSNYSQEERSKLLERVGDKLEEMKDEFSELITRELGISIKYSESYQVMPSINEARYFADFARNYKYIEKEKYGDLVRQPVGVVALMTPWNYPLDQITLKAFPAMVSGNCVIVKPSKAAPLTALMITEVLDEVGIPKGVFNMITGVGGEIGEYIASHEGVNLVSFTGSTEVGEKIGSIAVLNKAKNIVLEMGGKSAMILLEDANLDKAADDVMASVFVNSGQTCSAYTRLLVDSKVKREFENILVDKLKLFKVGNPMDKTVDMGPVISKSAMDKINNYIDIGIKEGAKILYKGETYADQGYYVPPVVFTEVNNKMNIAREEIFGPVLSIISFDDIDEAITIANDSSYGLDGAVYGNREEAIRIAMKLDTGNVHINGAEADVSMPFGGYKESGIGREGGRVGFEEYLEVKAIFK